MIIIGSGALNIVEVDHLYTKVNRPVYALLSHQNEALAKRAQRIVGQQGEVLFIVDLQQPFKKLNKKHNEQLVALYEEELSAIVEKHEQFLVVGGANGLFSSVTLQFLLKLLHQKGKKVKLITWLASPLDGKKLDSQMEHLLHRLSIKATVITPKSTEQPWLTNRDELNKEIAENILLACGKGGSI